MKRFLEALGDPSPGSAERRWLYVPYDQLSDRLGALAREEPGSLGIVLVESPEKAGRRPYHKQKLALVLANQRQFALEQAARGVAVRYVLARGSYGAALSPLIEELGPLGVMRPAERELRLDLAPLVEAGGLELLPHEGWLTSAEDFASSQPEGGPYRMDAFYRHVRRTTGVLMEDGKPAGQKISFDAENRKPWRGEPEAPRVPRFEPDAVTEEVIELVETRFAHHPGALDPGALPTTRIQAQVLLDWALEECLPHFGPYEDAMSEVSRSLFHTRLSPLIHLHRLTPKEVLDRTLALELPLASLEGFVRQLLGWREFMRHVHEATDGFRRLGDREVPEAEAPGDGGYERWKGEPWRGTGGTGGALPSALGAQGPLPPAFWGEPSGLRCLDRVVAEVWSSGYTHHIPRLMVLSNLATLLDVSPRELTDWFWVAFVDAYDWVVEPNVLGMGTFADGGLLTTKPYVCGAAYLDRMGDYCKACRFDPKRDCPVTALYWDFLERQGSKLAGNPRLRMPLAALRKRSEERRTRDRRVARRARRELAEGRELGGPEA